jgi:hypothetical protein
MKENVKENFLRLYSKNAAFTSRLSGKSERKEVMKKAQN